MNSSFINVIVSSKNRKQTDTNSSLTVQLLENIFVEDDEELYVSLASFNAIKSFYACQTGLNDYFQVFFKQDGQIINTFDRYLSPGNYNVKTLYEEIKSKTSALFQITYDNKLNKYLYKNNTFYEVFIKPKTAGIFMGFENDVEYEILATGTYSSTFINVSGYSQMIIKLEGDAAMDNTISNVSSSTYQYDKILSILPLQDIQPMDSITYIDDGANLFKYKVNNKMIPSFKIKILNEKGTEFPQMSDWIMLLKFEHVKKNSELVSMNQILLDIRYYIMSFYQYFQIPSRLTFNDLIDG
jgi:hypothetical protein